MVPSEFWAANGLQLLNVRKKRHFDYSLNFSHILVEDLCIHLRYKCWMFGSRNALPVVVTCCTSVLDPSLYSGVGIHISSSSYARIAASSLLAFSEGVKRRCQSKPKLNRSLIGSWSVCSEIVKTIEHMADARPASCAFVLVGAVKTQMYLKEQHHAVWW